MFVHFRKFLKFIKLLEFSFLFPLNHLVQGRVLQRDVRGLGALLLGGGVLLLVGAGRPFAALLRLGVRDVSVLGFLNLAANVSVSTTRIVGYTSICVSFHSLVGSRVIIICIKNK